MPWFYEDGTPVPPELEAQVQPDQPGFGRSALDVAGEWALGPAYEPRTPAGRRYQGIKEAALTMASGLPAMALGYLNQAGAPLVGQWPSYARHNLPVQEALTYVPRTEEGMEALEAVARNPLVNPRITQDLAEAAERRFGPEVGDIVGMVAHPANLLPFAGPLVRGGMRGARAGLRAGAERAALRTFGAPGKLAELMERRGEAAARAVGRELLELPRAELAQGPRGIRGTGARGRGGPVATALDPAGQQVSALAKAADATSETVDLGNVLAKFDAAAGWMAKDPFAAPRLAAVRDYVAGTAQRRGVWTPQGRQLLTLTPSEAHAMRQGLDKVITNAETGLRRNSPLVEQFGRLRRLVDEELGGAMERAGLGKEWEAANARYGRLKDIERLARAGYKLQVAHEQAPATRQRVYLGGRVPTPGMSVGRTSRPGYRWPAFQARLYQWLGGQPPTGRPFGF